jgi:hypothetical protein
MEVSSQPHVPAALPSGIDPPYLFDRRLGGPQSPSGRYGEKKNLWPLPAIEPHFVGRPASGPWQEPNIGCLCFSILGIFVVSHKIHFNAILYV